MYKCVMWSGKNLPLPKILEGKPQSTETWTPLFGAKKNEMPLFWWFLVGRFNCFWLKDGSPTFLVKRSTAIEVADSHFQKLAKFIPDHQHAIWNEFRKCLHSTTSPLSASAPKLPFGRSVFHLVGR